MTKRVFSSARCAGGQFASGRDVKKSAGVTENGVTNAARPLHHARIVEVVAMSHIRCHRITRLGPGSCLLALLATTCAPSEHEIDSPGMATTADPTISRTPEGPVALRKISGNHLTTCTIDSDHSVRCWGPPTGSAVRADDSALAEPRLFDTARYAEVAAGAFHVCAIRDDGTVWCRGRNCTGQLGDAAVSDASTLVQVPLTSGQNQIAVGGGHTCVINAADELTCWGGADYGQTDCSSSTKQRPITLPGRWRRVSANYYGVHAIDGQRQLRRWLHGAHPKDPLFQDTPETIGEARWQSIATGVAFACGVREDGSLAYVRDDASEEVQLGNDRDWQGVVAADYRVCAIKQDGSLWCTDNSFSYSDAAPLEQIGAHTDWHALSVGIGHACGIRDGAVSCWGDDAYGQLGWSESLAQP